MTCYGSSFPCLLTRGAFRPLWSSSEAEQKYSKMSIESYVLSSLTAATEKKLVRQRKVLLLSNYET